MCSIKYYSVTLGDEASKYILRVSGYSEDAGDSFNDAGHRLGLQMEWDSLHLDSENDQFSGEKCAGSGWWWNYLGISFLNGQVISWHLLQGRMMIKSNEWK